VISTTLCGERPLRSSNIAEKEERPSFDAAGTGKKSERAKLSTKSTKYDVEMPDAAEYGHDEEVAALLSHGASFKAKSKTGETAMHLAARYGHKTTVELLLNANEAVNGEDD
jgi:ankyrin repeat protein